MSEIVDECIMCDVGVMAKHVIPEGILYKCDKCGFTEFIGESDEDSKVLPYDHMDPPQEDCP